MTVVETQDEIVCQEVASVTYGYRESASLLGPVGRSMRLKVSRDEPRTSDIVELASRRCLVGSAPSCDVQVDEPGVAPIACLIFHGSKNNVVRWLDASQEFAGGELFQDEVLGAGDALQIGPVELELLVDEIMAAGELARTDVQPETGEDRIAEYILRLERLEIQLVELQQASDLSAPSSCADDSNREVAATIRDLATQLAVLQSRNATDRDLWAGEKAELEGLLQSRLREFDFWQEEVQRLRDELVTVRGEYGSLTANHDAGQLLAEASQALAKRTEVFEQEHSNWERDRGELQRALQQNLERLERFETQLAEQSTRQAESEAARRAAEARADRLQESVEELSTRLAEQQQDYESVRAAWEAERTSLESELEAQRRQLEEQRQRRDDSWREELAFDQPSEAADQRTDRGISLAPNNPMDRLLAGSSLADDGADAPGGRLRDFLALKPMMGDDAESENPDDSDADSGYGRAADVASNYYEQAFSGLPSAAYLNDVTELADDEVEEIIFEAASPAPPVSTADVLAGLGRSGLWGDDDTDAEDSSDVQTAVDSNSPTGVYWRCAAPSTPVSQTAEPHYTPIDEMPFAPSIANAASDSGDEEESIEAYMARLMNRVRGHHDVGEPPRPVQPTVERSPVTEYTEVAKVPHPDRDAELEKFHPEEYKPRSQAPEMADRMTAMRSLANDSARTAIASHAKRNWSSAMKLKLLVSTFAFVAIVASVIFFWGHPLLMGLGSLVGVGVLAYWARNAITYRKLWLESLILEPRGGDDDSTAGEDAADVNAR